MMIVMRKAKHLTKAASGERIAKQCEENVESKPEWGTREP